MSSAAWWRLKWMDEPSRAIIVTWKYLPSFSKWGYFKREEFALPLLRVDSFWERLYILGNLILPHHLHPPPSPPPPPPPPSSKLCLCWNRLFSHCPSVWMICSSICLLGFGLCIVLGGGRRDLISTAYSCFLLLSSLWNRIVAFTLEWVLYLFLKCICSL